MNETGSYLPKVYAYGRMVLVWANTTEVAELPVEGTGVGWHAGCLPVLIWTRSEAEAKRIEAYGMTGVQMGTLDRYPLYTCDAVDWLNIHLRLLDLSKS